MENNTSNGTVEAGEGEDWWTSYTPRLGVWKTVIVSVVLVLITVGNLVVMVVVRKVRSLPLVSRVGMISLALSDLMVGMVYAPFALHMSLGKQAIIKVWCVANCYLGIYFSSVSMCNMAGTSLDRFLTVSLPLVYRKHSSTKKCMVIVCMAWFFPAVCFIPLFLTKLKMKYFPDSLTCSLDFYHHYAWTVFMIVVIFGLCSIIIAVSNVKLYKIATRHVRAIRKQDRDNPASGTGESRRGRRRSSATHPTVSKILITVVVTFYSCWTPLMTYKVFTFVDRTDGPHGLGFALVWIAMCHSFLNVVTYCVFSAEFRMGLRQLLLACCGDKFPCKKCCGKELSCKRCELQNQPYCTCNTSISRSNPTATESCNTGVMLTCAAYFKAKGRCFVGNEVVTVVKVVKGAGRVMKKSSSASSNGFKFQDRTSDMLAPKEMAGTRNSSEIGADRLQVKPFHKAKNQGLSTETTKNDKFQDRTVDMLAPKEMAGTRNTSETGADRLQANPLHKANNQGLATEITKNVPETLANIEPSAQPTDDEKESLKSLGDQHIRGEGKSEDVTS
ncbi:PREDICTED: probable G-protein coupled receptor 52 [Branchiostoma belcheri]|uniref:Probable G-protein coupled receptor 52 n=1 Tax=Branchiostoma belcheri TaxID=7741 RepID=A0A6P5A7S8_BRABE|nr:PREDICTED: probable G-protein coupled receptor 52 [Branchiostoma belcheri]